MRYKVAYRITYHTAQKPGPAGRINHLNRSSGYNRAFSCEPIHFRAVIHSQILPHLFLFCKVSVSASGVHYPLVCPPAFDTIALEMVNCIVMRERAA
jgi:hypothetical protein